MGELAALTDMEASLRTWAAEALLPQPDGFWGADSNYYVYDHPRRGFIWLTDDLDATFDFMPVDMHPLYFWLNRDQPWREPGPQYVAVMADDTWRARFVQIMAQLLDGWDVTALQERVDRWSAQIAAPLEADPNKATTFAAHQAQQKKLREFIAARPEAVRRWLACYQGGGVDADGDGHTWCWTATTRHPRSTPAPPRSATTGSTRTATAGREAATGRAAKLGVICVTKSTSSMRISTVQDGWMPPSSSAGPELTCHCSPTI